MHRCQIETCINNTMNKLEFWIKQSCNNVKLKEILVAFNLFKPNTCLFRTHKLVPRRFCLDVSMYKLHKYFCKQNNKITLILLRVRVMVFNITFNNISVISWQSVLLVEETKVQEKTTELPQVTDKQNVVSSTPRLSRIRTHNISGDRPRRPLYYWRSIYQCNNIQTNAWVILIYIVIIQCNMSKPNLFDTNFYVLNRQVFCL